MFIRLETPPASKFIFFDLNRLSYRENIVFNALGFNYFNINVNDIESFIKFIIGEEQFNNKAFFKHLDPPEYYGNHCEIWGKKSNLQLDFKYKELIIDHFTIGKNSYIFLNVSIDFHAGETLQRPPKQGLLTPRTLNGAIKVGNIKINYQIANLNFLPSYIKNRVITLKFNFMCDQSANLEFVERIFQVELIKYFGKVGFLVNPDNHPTIQELEAINLLNFSNYKLDNYYFRVSNDSKRNYELIKPHIMKFK